MTENERLALIHAEIDGELDGEQRGELVRLLLADPQARALRDDLRRLCEALETLAQVEPPRQLSQDIVDALPQSGPARMRSWWSVPPLRYAAVIVVGLIAGTVLYEVVRGPKLSPTELVGMMGPATQPTILDATRLDTWPVVGRVSLYRDPAGLILKLDLTTSAPVDVLIAAGGHTQRINGVGGQDNPGQRKPAGALTVELPGLRMGGDKVDLTFLMDGRQVESATLRVPGGR